MDLLSQLERETYLMKLMLVLMRDRRARQGQVRSIGYTREYGELPDNLGVATLAQLSNEELFALAEQIGVKKRPATGKSDIYMNDLGYMLVSATQAVILLERTDLNKLIALAEQLRASELMDIIANIKIELKSSYNEGEIIKNALSDLTQFTDYREQWIKLLGFILCNGVEPSVCRFPAELVLRYGDPLNMNSWNIFAPDAFITAIRDSLEFIVYEDHSVTIQLKVGNNHDKLLTV